MNNKKVIIIGAGPGGLASSILLASQGFDVTILERLDRVGGRTSTFELDQFRFDLGPTFFLYPKMLNQVLNSVGRNLEDEIEMVRLDPQYRLVFGEGGQINATSVIERMEAEIERISPQDVAGFKRFMDENRVKLNAFDPILQKPFQKLTDLLRPEVLKASGLLRPWRSLFGDLSRYFKDDRLKLAFSFQGKYLGMSPFQCPSLFTILAFLEYEHGVFHPTGGCGAVSDMMARVAREVGVKIHLSEPVTRLGFEGKKVRSVYTSEDCYNADAVVVNGDFARMMNRFVPDSIRGRWTKSKLNKAKLSCSTFMLYLGVEGEQPQLPHHTIYLSENYRQNINDIQKLGRLSDDPSFYVQNACVTDRTLAPEGQSTLYVLVPVPNNRSRISWGQEALPFRKKILRQLEKVGLKNVEQRIVAERMITPADWDLSFEIHEGATFNLAHSLDQMLMFRPRNRFEEIDGMYLVGGGTHPGSGLPTIYASAKITSELIAKDFGVTPSAASQMRSNKDVYATTVD